MNDPLIFGQTVLRSNIRDYLAGILDEPYQRSRCMTYMGVPLHDLSRDELLGVAVHYFDLWELMIKVRP